MYEGMRDFRHTSNGYQMKMEYKYEGLIIDVLIPKRNDSEINIQVAEH